MFVDLYFPGGFDLDEDDVLGAIELELGNVVSVVGAGVGQDVTNLDLEIATGVDLRTAMGAIVAALSKLGAPGSTSIWLSEPRRRLTLSELRATLLDQQS